MALILVSGLPCSGRTSRSEEMIKDFKKRIESLPSSSSISSFRIVHLTNSEANVTRSQFSTQIKEKPARAAYLSLVMRSIAKDAIVIADGGAGTNIKGFRYQLWCAAREVGVRCASVLCASKPETCRRRNEGRKGNTTTTKQDEAYDQNTFEELLMRFEEPNPMTRWDKPLFVIDCTPKEGDDESTCESIPLDAIWEAITTGEITKAPDVVAPVRATTNNYLSLLETTTQSVLSALQILHSSGTLPEMGGEIKLSVQMQYSLPAIQKVTLFLPAGKRAPTTAILQRLRRQFVKMHATSAASQNEIGFALGQEGRYTVATNDDQQNSTGGNSRVERKLQQHQNNNQTSQKQKTSEEEVVSRFVAYLEETL